MKWIKDKIVSIYHWATTNKEKIPTVNLEEMDKDKDHSEFWKNVGGNEDTIFNNPDSFVLPLAKIAFYILVVLFLVPTNAVGNALTNESSANTLVDKLDAMGFENVSNYLLGKMIILSTLICSASITGAASHEETLKVTPDMDSEYTSKFIFHRKINPQALREKADSAYKAKDSMMTTAMTYFKAYDSRVGEKKGNTSHSLENKTSSAFTVSEDPSDSVDASFSGWCKH